MSKATDIRVERATVTIEPITFRMPLKFGGRVIEKSRLINVQVTVESRNKKHAVGFGSMPVGNVWAWPSNDLSPEQTENAMVAFAEEVVEMTNDFEGYGHALEIAYQISGEYTHLAKSLSKKLGLSETLPELAQMVAASPVDAALHDAYGKVHLLNSYNTLSSTYLNDDISKYLDAQFQGEYLDKYTLREPKDKMPLYHLVGALDPLTVGEIAKPLKDGLPEALGDWITANGLTHLKIKLNGDDLKWDIDRVLAVDQVAVEVQGRRGCTSWNYSVDFNEKCQDVQYVLDFLAAIREQAPQAYDRIQYVEQPTHRNLSAHPIKMHAAAQLKPIVIDESLISYDSLLAARELGYSGIALKACKGHTEAILAAAAAQKFGMFLCVQDLTCPGFSFLHSASLAARIPGVAAIEGNARQYCPSANKVWARSFPGMFQVKDGCVPTGMLNGIGLGF